MISLTWARPRSRPTKNIASIVPMPRGEVMSPVLSALPVRSTNNLRKLSLSRVLRYPRLCYKGLTRHDPRRANTADHATLAHKDTAPLLLDVGHRPRPLTRCFTAFSARRSPPPLLPPRSSTPYPLTCGYA